MIKFANKSFSKNAGWKIGDEVKCIGISGHPQDNKYEVGGIYTLSATFYENDNTNLILDEVQRTGVSGTFELVKRKKWSEWESVSEVKEHTEYYVDATYETRFVMATSPHGSIDRQNIRYRIKHKKTPKPQKFKVGDKKYTVSFDNEKEPIWTTVRMLD